MDLIRDISTNSESNGTAGGYQFDGSEKLLDLLCENTGWNWELFGAFLCVEFADIETIRADEDVSKNKLRAIFDCKIQCRTYRLSWPSIHRALQCIGENRLIKKIETDFPEIAYESFIDNELEKPNWTYFIGYLSQQLSKSWKDLARYFKIKIDTIEKDYKRVESQTFALLRKAYEGENQLDWNVLSNALEYCKRNDVLRDVAEKEEFFHLMK